MTPAFLLCLALATAQPPLTGNEVLRGCALAHAVEPAAVATRQDPAVLLAIAWRETRFQHLTNGGGYHGPWQLRAGLCIGCSTMEQALSAAGVLQRFQRNRRPLADALRKYSGSRLGSTWYADKVLSLADAWRVP